MENETQHEDMNKVIGISVGAAAAAAAAAAGAYWLYGSKHSARHRKLAKSWMLKARAEVMDGIEKLQNVDKSQYMALVDGVMKRYAGAVNPAEAAAMMADFKRSWSHVQRAQKALAPAKKKAKSSSKKKASSRSRAASKSKR